MEGTYLLTIQQCAKESMFSEWFIKKEIREGRLAKRKFGRAVRIERAEFERWAQCRDFEGSTPVGGGVLADSPFRQVLVTTRGNR